MDRRHIILVVAVGATVADEPTEVLWASAALDGPVFRVDPDRRERAWAITYTAVLSREAMKDSSSIDVQVDVSPNPLGTDPPDVAVAFGDCDPSTVFDEGVGDESEWEVLDECAPEVPCSRTYCLLVSNREPHGDVELTWHTEAEIWGYGDLRDDATAELSIDAEEIEP